MCAIFATLSSTECISFWWWLCTPSYLEHVRFWGIVCPVVLLLCLCSDNNFLMSSVPGAAPHCAFPVSLCPWSSTWLCWACTGHSLSSWMNDSTSQLLWWGWVVLWFFQVRQQYNSLFSLAACLHQRRGTECFGDPVLPCSNREWAQWFGNCCWRQE